jgi:ketol-acid reductoisomerase
MNRQEERGAPRSGGLSDPERQLQLRNAHITVLGYGRAAREHAIGLRNGFIAQPPTVLIGGADVVVVLVPDDEQASVYWHAIEPLLAPGALLVFARGLALATRAFEPRSHDVVLVAGELGSSSQRCRVAVHHDATGHALDRAIAYARTAFGLNAAVGTTTIAAEVEAELSELAAQVGGRDALIATIDERAARVRESHAPEEAKVAFYEGLSELLTPRPAESQVRAIDRSESPLHARGPGGRA